MFQFFSHFKKFKNSLETWKEITKLKKKEKSLKSIAKKQLLNQQC